MFGTHQERISDRACKNKMKSTVTTAVAIMPAAAGLVLAKYEKEKWTDTSLAAITQVAAGLVLAGQWYAWLIFNKRYQVLCMVASEE